MCVGLISFLRILYVETLCGGNARRRMEMEIRSWKGDLKGATFLAKEDIEN
jgi:hypothetical protein